MPSPAAVEAFSRFVALEHELAAYLSQTFQQEESMLAAMLGRLADRSRAIGWTARC
jgi:hypothetical protein